MCEALARGDIIAQKRIFSPSGSNCIGQYIFLKLNIIHFTFAQKTFNCILSTFFLWGWKDLIFLGLRHDGEWKGFKKYSVTECDAGSERPLKWMAYEIEKKLSFTCSLESHASFVNPAKIWLGLMIPVS